MPKTLVLFMIASSIILFGKLSLARDKNISPNTNLEFESLHPTDKKIKEPTRKLRAETQPLAGDDKEKAETAKRLGLDPKTATWDQIEERRRSTIAEQLGLDPKTATWDQINSALDESMAKRQRENFQRRGKR